MAETEEVDRISNLPDALLSEILSLLSTKEAVATSILSKRWEYIWTEVPVLDFSYSKDKLSSNFTTFVNRVLILNDAPVIRLFRLNLYQEDDEEIEDMHVWSWIRNTMRRDVLEIDVICGTPEARGLVSEKLKVLKLRCPLKGSRLLYSFPILSILHLEFCYIEDHDSMNNIWSGLPCLNEFLLYHCHGLQNLRIQSSSLKRLTVAGTLFRMEGLVIIEAPSLEYISIEDQVYCCEFDINIPSLVEADIDICGMIDGISAAEFLKHFHSMKTLNLMIPTPLAVMVDAQMQPLFPELTCLDVRTMCYLSQNLHIILLFQMCQHAPNLVSLKYKIESRTMEESPSLPNVVPKFFSSTLKAIDVDNFRGTFADNAVIEYILQHAIVLKVIRIHFEKNSTMAADAFSQLFKIPTASSACKIMRGS